jgi:hypothetical protein
MEDLPPVVYVGYVMCDVTLKHDEISMELKDVTLHILPSLSFDVMIGSPCIRKNILVHIFSYLFSERSLQVHNCTKCRQCLPKGFQQERAPSDGETQSKVLLTVLCVDALNLLREPGKVPCDLVEAKRSGCPSGHASTLRGLIGDREASDLAPVQRSWTAGTKVADSGRKPGGVVALAVIRRHQGGW